MRAYQAALALRAARAQSVTAACARARSGPRGLEIAGDRCAPGTQSRDPCARQAHRATDSHRLAHKQPGPAMQARACAQGSPRHGASPRVLAARPVALIRLHIAGRVRRCALRSSSERTGASAPEGSQPQPAALEDAPDAAYLLAGQRLSDLLAGVRCGRARAVPRDVRPPTTPPACVSACDTPPPLPAAATACSPRWRATRPTSG